MVYVLQRAPVGDLPRHPTIEYAVVEAASLRLALHRFFSTVDAPASVTMDDSLSAPTADAAIDLVRGAESRAAFRARADVLILEGGA